MFSLHGVFICAWLVVLENATVLGKNYQNIPGFKDSAARCYEAPAVDWSFTEILEEQPIFVAFLPKTETNQLIDNICYTVFPTADDPLTITMYMSTVYQDGSYSVESNIGTELSNGMKIVADPFCTILAYFPGYAGCNVHVAYWCFLFGDCTAFPGPYLLGLSTEPVPLALSCLRAVEDIVLDAGFPSDLEFVILPMKLPNRCVTQQLCVNNAQGGTFYEAMGLPAQATRPLFLP